MSEEGWVEYTGQELPDEAVVQVRWPEWHEYDSMLLNARSLAGATRTFPARGRMEFRELIQLHEAEQAIREAWNYGFAKGALDDQAEYRSAKEFLATWRERRKG